MKIKPAYTETFLSQLSCISLQTRKGNSIASMSEAFHNLNKHWEKSNKIILKVLPIILTSKIQQTILEILNQTENLDNNDNNNSSFNIIQIFSIIHSAIDAVLYDNERIKSISKIELILLENLALQATLKKARQKNKKIIKKTTETPQTNITQLFLIELAFISLEAAQGNRLASIDQEIIKIKYYWKNHKLKLIKILASTLSKKTYKDTLTLLKIFENNDYNQGSASFELKQLFTQILSEINAIIRDTQRIDAIHNIELTMFKNDGLKYVIKQLTEEPVQPPTSKMVQLVQQKKREQITAERAAQANPDPSNIDIAQDHLKNRITKGQEALDSSNLNIAQDQLKQYNNETQANPEPSILEIAQAQMQKYKERTQATPEPSILETAQAQIQKYKERTQSSK